MRFLSEDAGQAEQAGQLEQLTLQTALLFNFLCIKKNRNNKFISFFLNELLIYMLSLHPSLFFDFIALCLLKYDSPTETV